MYSLMYRSTAAVTFRASDLAELVMVCRAKNRKLGVTGMLAYEHGTFLQTLEGPEYMVHEVMELIARDRRHSQIEILSEQQIDKRRYPDWAMGYARIDAAERELLGADGIPYRTTEAATQEPEPRPQSLLRRILRSR